MPGPCLLSPSCPVSPSPDGRETASIPPLAGRKIEGPALVTVFSQRPPEAGSWRLEMVKEVWNERQCKIMWI